MGNGKIYLYEKKRDQYKIRRTTFNVPKEVRNSIEGRKNWENASDHPSIYDPDLDAVMIFGDMEAYHLFLECKRIWQGFQENFKDEEGLKIRRMLGLTKPRKK